MKAIVLYDENFAIARKGEQIARIPADLKRFREITMGNTVVMGTKTAEAIGHPLEGRRNVVLTHNPGTWWEKHRGLGNESDSGWEITQPSVFLDILLKGSRWEFQRTFIIGGASIYAYFLPVTEWIYATEIHANLHGDQYFPEFMERTPPFQAIQSGFDELPPVKIDAKRFSVFHSEPEETWNGLTYQRRTYVRNDLWAEMSRRNYADNHGNAN